jgi:hypothetical protein
MPMLKPRLALPSVDNVVSFNDASTSNVGNYECVDAETGETLFSENVFVRSKTSLFVTLSQEEKFVRVTAGKSALVPCRLADPTEPKVKIELLGQVH